MTKKTEYSGGAHYAENLRPQFHFTAKVNWLNDPNGMFFYDGKYHLFYQHNPFGNDWGHMSWGHAVSTDLVHWEHRPVALKEEDGQMIFSGCAVVDWQNSSGFGNGEKPPVVALYTSHRSMDGRQSQSLAYSTDGGDTWAKYAGNPVIDIGSRDFRDPKVFRHQASGKWIMVVALSAERKVRIYGSRNLREWAFLSDFGPAGEIEGVWECPDLFPLAVDGDEKDLRWVLQTGVISGGVGGGSGGQYFIGRFDGQTFHYDWSRVSEGKLLTDFEKNDIDGWQRTGMNLAGSPAPFRNGDRPGEGAENTPPDSGGEVLESPPFEISAKYIYFLIGGVQYPGRTVVNLVVDGVVVRSATGRDTERRHWHTWNVADIKGRKAVLQIIDYPAAGRTNLTLDHIILSDTEGRSGFEAVLWVDHGNGFYAGVTWSDMVKRDRRRIWMAWMGSWRYARDIPTHPWRGNMSIPRELQLRTTPQGIRLFQQPVGELKMLRREAYEFIDLRLSPGENSLNDRLPAGKSLEIEAVFEPLSAADFGIKVCKGGSEETVIGYRSAENRLYVDRIRSGPSGIHPDFSGIHRAPLMPEDNRIRIHIYVDRSAVEVFGNDGRVVISDLIFPSPESDGLEIFTLRGEVHLERLTVWTLSSIWNSSRNRDVRAASRENK